MHLIVTRIPRYLHESVKRIIIILVRFIGKYRVQQVYVISCRMGEGITITHNFVHVGTTYRYPQIFIGFFHSFLILNFKK